MYILIADIALAALIAAAVFVRGVWPLEPAAGVLTQLGLTAVVLALISLAVAQPIGAALLSLSAGLAFWRTREALAPASPDLADAQMKVVWANLFRRRQSFEAVQRLALTEQADIVALGEFPEGAKLLPQFADAYPHQFPQDPTRLRDIVMFSRLPLQSAKAVYSAWRRPNLAVSVNLANEPLTVIATHAPVPWTPKRQEMQRRHIAEIFAGGDNRKTPFIVVGDFNAAPWSAVLGRPVAIERLRLGARATWLLPLPLLGIPIDHAFVSKGLEGSVALGPFNGSDHFPIIASVKRSPGPLS